MDSPLDLQAEAQLCWHLNFSLVRPILDFWPLELPDNNLMFRDQIANICQIMEKATDFQKNICFIDYAKVFDGVNHNKLENS